VAARLKSMPDGTLLRAGFHGLAIVALGMMLTDLRETMSQRADPFALPALSPMPMDRPTEDDQIRPYLPKSRPVAPDSDLLRLRDRPREADEAAPMRFRLGPAGTLLAEGTITPGTADLFEEALDDERAGAVREIVIHSPGGSVDDASEMAQLIRDRGLSTRVLPDGYCASSCPLVFAGGVERVADATSWIGVHQVFALTTAFGSLADGMEQAQRVSAEAQNLLAELGVDPLVWTHAMSTPREKLYLFTPAELLELELATRVEGEGGGSAR
jgi:hypothetical protein